MSTTNAKGWVRERPRATVATLTVVGYALVLGTLYVGLPIYPDIDLATVNLLSHAIAAINTVNVFVILAGIRFIRRGEVKRHATAMVTSFTLILVFLVLYLLKTGGGGTKEIALSGGPIYVAYLAMLAIHILLSILAVPVVLYALVLGATHTPHELRTQTPHKRVGRLAAGSWLLSLTLGVVTYVMLNHVYGFDYVPA